MEKENCISCLHPITNPVCTDCYVKEVDEYLDHQGINTTARGIVLDKLKQHSNQESLNEERCILCENSSLTLCSYCFFFRVSRTLRELNFHEEFIEDFEAIFSYQDDY